MTRSWAAMQAEAMTSSYWRDGKCIWPGILRSTKVLDLMHGLGDTLYQRAFVRQYPNAYVLTPWPEMFADMQVTPLKSALWLHYTQPEDSRYKITPPYIDELTKIKFWYHPEDLEVRAPYSICGTFDRITAKTRQPGPLTWSFPPLPKSKHPGCAFVRPISVRGLTHEPSRACAAEYLHEAVRQLKKAGYTTVSASWAKPGSEVNIDPPECDLMYNEGQLGTMDMLALLNEAAVAVGSVSWFVPGVLCSRTPTAVIMGGYQKHNSPQQLMHADMQTDHVTWFQTDNPCLCSDMAHRCDKTITDFPEKFSSWLASVSK